MKPFSLLLIVIFTPLLLTGQSTEVANQKRVTSTIDSTMTPELVLIQEFKVKAKLDEVWKAYTTADGWEQWAVPMAKVDLKVGGTIKTNYNAEGRIGDSTTIVTHIVNYVPKRLLTLQAEITDNFPEFMKADAEHFYNLIYMDAVDEDITQVRSYGIGYKNTPKYLGLMNYFIPANERTLMQLIQYLEKE